MITKTKYFTTGLLVTMITLLLSCTKNNDVKKQILNYKDNQVTYQVYEHTSKVNDDDIDQCKNFLEFSSSNTGFELYGASIADVYSNLMGVDRANVTLDDKKAIFYSIVYNGPKNDTIIKDVVNKLLTSRNLKVTTNAQVVGVYTLPENALQILDTFASTTKDAASGVTFSNNKLQLNNGTLPMLINALNQHYPNTFATNLTSTSKFNLTIPILNTASQTINYIKANYGITFTKQNKTITYYTISANKAK